MSHFFTPTHNAESLASRVANARLARGGEGVHANQLLQEAFLRTPAKLQLSIVTTIALDGGHE